MFSTLIYVAYPSYFRLIHSIRTNSSRDINPLRPDFCVFIKIFFWWYFAIDREEIKGIKQKTKFYSSHYKKKIVHRYVHVVPTVTEICNRRLLFIKIFHSFYLSYYSFYLSYCTWKSTVSSLDQTQIMYITFSAKNVTTVLAAFIFAHGGLLVCIKFRKMANIGNLNHRLHFRCLHFSDFPSVLLQVCHTVCS